MRTTVFMYGIEYRYFNRSYAVARNGDVLRFSGLKIVTPTKQSAGYLQIRRGDLVHRMVATCWLDKPEGAIHVHHKNRDKTDNRAENLEWVTPQDHLADRHKGEFGKFNRTAETREKLRQYRTGRKHDPETIEKIRQVSLSRGSKPPPRPVGYKCSEDAKAKMRLNSPNGTRCEIGGVQYRSFGEAGEKLGIKPHTIRKRCFSANFPDYRVVITSSAG